MSSLFSAVVALVVVVLVTLFGGEQDSDRKSPAERIAATDSAALCELL